MELHKAPLPRRKAPKGTLRRKAPKGTLRRKAPKKTLRRRAVVPRLKAEGVEEARAGQVGSAADPHSRPNQEPRT